MRIRYMDGFYELLHQRGLVPVVVLDRVADALPVARALADGGLPCAEVTFRTPAAADAIHEIATHCPKVMVGAGTVLNVRQAVQAVEAGASFVVSPGTSPAVVDWCISQRVPVVPGTVTPTELTTVINRGLGVSKFFPANLYGGLAGVETLASVFVGHRFMPTGGVSTDNLQDYLRSPAVIACGGTWITRRDLIAAKDFARIEELATQAATLVREARG